jgi:UDP-glucose 4-epimerase
MDTSIALIGGGGFIGTNLTNFFSENNYNVLIIGRNVVEDPNNLNVKVKRKLIDVNKTSRLIEELHEYQNIVWLVNDLVPSSTMDSLVDDFAFNITPLINFLELSKSLVNLKRFIFISSGGTIYGDTSNEMHFDEESNLSPKSAYGLSKLISENYVSYITRKSHFQSIILRPSNVYGNFQNFKKPQGIVGYAFNAALKTKIIDIYGDGNMTRDFVHVLDLAEAIKLCIECRIEKAKVDIYNVGSQEGITIKQILKYISEVSGVTIQQISKPIRLFDCNYSVLSIDKIKNDLGWQPKIHLKEGLEAVWEWISSDENK